jgi:hypothetical protein
MTLPSNETCARVIRELDGDPSLTKWEDEFVRSNKGRTEFSTAQKDVIARLLEKYEV